MAVIAVQLGHADSPIPEKRHAHRAPSASTIRAHFPAPGPKTFSVAIFPIVCYHYVPIAAKESYVPQFMLIASDAGSGISAFEIAKNRLSRQLWPIYKGTRNRFAMRAGDAVCIYIGGAKEFRQAFIAQATIVD
jgi:hypothetical protein